MDKYGRGNWGEEGGEKGDFHKGKERALDVNKGMRDREDKGVRGERILSRPINSYDW